jgi:hypothetical protein
MQNILIKLQFTEFTWGIIDRCLRVADLLGVTVRIGINPLPLITGLLIKVSINAHFTLRITVTPTVSNILKLELKKKRKTRDTQHTGEQQSCSQVVL